jgi:hypothetical protein
MSNCFLYSTNMSVMVYPAMHKHEEVCMIHLPSGLHGPLHDVLLAAGHDAVQVLNVGLHGLLHASRHHIPSHGTMDE